MRNEIKKLSYLECNGQYFMGNSEMTNLCPESGDKNKLDHFDFSLVH